MGGEKTEDLTKIENGAKKDLTLSDKKKNVAAISPSLEKATDNTQTIGPSSSLSISTSHLSDLDKNDLDTPTFLRKQLNSSAEGLSDKLDSSKEKSVEQEAKVEEASV